MRLTRKANPIQKQKGSSLLTQCCEGFSGTRYGRSLTREGPGSLSSSSKQRVDPTDSSVQLNIWIAHMNPQVFYDLHIYCVQTLFSLYVTYTMNRSTKRTKHYSNEIRLCPSTDLQLSRCLTGEGIELGPVLTLGRLPSCKLRAPFATHLIKSTSGSEKEYIRI